MGKNFFKKYFYNLKLNFCLILKILHMRISSIEKLPLTTTGSPLLIRCKTFLFVTFIIPRERDCYDVYQTLLKLYQPGKLFK